jgi:RNA polymerase sigma factor (sigma-70 family)
MPMSALADTTGTAVGTMPPDAAARTLYERYSNRIFRYCLHRLHSVEEAEDAAQTAFLYAFVGLRRGVTPEFEVAWLYKIAENVCRTRIRSRARRGRFETTDDLHALLDVVPAADRTGGDEIDALPQILAGMPSSQRRALLLREVQGMSYREIAEQLQTSVSAVETLLFRARRSCARELERLTRPAGNALSAASVLSALKALVSRSLATGPGAKVAVLAAAAATGGALVATPHLVHHGAAKTPAVSHPPAGVTPVRLGATGSTGVATAKRAPHDRPARGKGTAAHKPGPAAAPSASGPAAPSSTPAASTPAPVSSSAGGAPPQPSSSAPTTQPAQSNPAPADPQPPVTLPPVTVPPVTVPPITVPPVVQLPPVTIPSVTVPSVTVPSIPAPTLPPLPHVP